MIVPGNMFLELTSIPRSSASTSDRHTIEHGSDLAMERLVGHVGIGVTSQTVAKLAIHDNLRAVFRVTRLAGQRFATRPRSLPS